MFAEGILLGNRIYAELDASNQLVNENLNVPEAMDATRLYSGDLEEWVETKHRLHYYTYIPRMMILI